MGKDTIGMIEQMGRRIDACDEDIKSLRESRHDHARRVGNLEGGIAQVKDRIATVSDNNDKLEHAVEHLREAVEASTRVMANLNTTINVSLKTLKITASIIGAIATLAIAAHGVGWL